MIPYGKHSISITDVIEVVKQMLTSTLTQGSRISELEKSIASFVGSKYAVAVSSGTAGLHLSLLSLNLPAASRVLTSPISFVSSSNAALYCNLEPKFVDIDSEFIAMDENLVLQEIKTDEQISAIVPVHFGGFATDLSKIFKESRKKDIKIIEDAAHALGAKYPDGTFVGSCRNSDLTVFSLHPVKTITSGEGGIITTNNEILYRKLLALRSHGIEQHQEYNKNSLLAKTSKKNNPWYYEMQFLGFHYRLTEIQAALAISQLRRIKKFINKRKKIANFYNRKFANFTKIRTSIISRNPNSSHHLYIIHLRFGNLQKSKQQLIELFKKNGFTSQVHYKPIPLNPYYVNLGYKVDNIPNAMHYFNNALSIPIFPKLRIFQQRKIINSIKKEVDSAWIN